ncbi:DUF2059 domain-containing protein [Sphingopyxis sp.]|uniref:DUF2059 domain-containing protein n=1 Tax=Sphingopyxis sp. TaxID=1908224 RepID=UPI002B4A917C|nr:DUF2059 domain-containing protein [Sphingopyxis sp.]HJS09687.1 DUF2059 domain-containing protein [Sphingopyxis sp.]
MTNRERIMPMPRWKSALFGVALVATPISAHAEPSEPAVEVTADRLASAQRLMATLMPAEQRDAMVEQMITAMMANFTPGIKQRIEAEGRLENPEVVKVFDRFIERQTRSAIDQLKAEMPKMIEAMSRAYARRFTVAQMNEMYAFFSTPTGGLYVTESMGIMSDPDISTWQRDAMTKSMEKLPEELKKLQEELQEVLGRADEEKKA